jgi:serine/threonine protein phosphatase 1
VEGINSMNLIKRFAKNELGRDFVVGDIHGCFTKLAEKLTEVSFDETKDRLFSVGDLVDRGPESEQCLDWMVKPYFHSVLGNHEQMAISYFDGEAPAEWYFRNGGAWFIASLHQEQIKYVDIFRELPIALEVETEKGLIGIIHAECPVISWLDLNDALTGHNKMPYKEMAIWSRTKIQDQDYDRINDIHAVFVGHTVVETPVQLGNVHYIDTGAVFDRELTLIDMATYEY